MDKYIYILLPIHNRKDITIKFVECLKKQKYINFELILIDDGSTDGTAEQVKKIIKNVSVISGNGDLWWAGSLNAGIKYLKEKKIDDNNLILIINDDVNIDADFLSTGVALISSMPRTLLLAQNYNIETRAVQETGTTANLYKLDFNIATSKEKINCLSTRGLLLSWANMKEIGLFRSKLIPHYASDYEYTIRAFEKGFSLKTDPSFMLSNSAEHTGIREMLDGTFKQRIAALFSRRYVRNPIYWTNFIILRCPWTAIINNIAKIWIKELTNLFVSKKSKDV